MHLLDERAGHLVLEDGRSPAVSEEPDADGGAGDVALGLVVQQEDTRVGGGAHAGHEPGPAQLLLDGRHLVEVGDEVGVAHGAGIAGHEVHVEVIEARLHHRPRLPFRIRLSRRLEETIEGLVAEHCVEAVLEEVEGATIADGRTGGRNDHLKAHVPVFQDELHGTGETKRGGDEAGDRLHEAIRLAFDHSAAIHIGVEHEPSPAGVGNAADNLQAVVAPDGTTGDGQGCISRGHENPLVTRSIASQTIIRNLIDAVRRSYLM